MAPPTARQLEILDLVTRPGASIKSVAADMRLAQGTVKSHLGRLYRSLGVNSAAQAARELRKPK